LSLSVPARIHQLLMSRHVFGGIIPPVVRKTGKVRRVGGECDGEPGMSALPKLEETIPALRRYAWALLRNASDADDLVQDCVLRAIERIDTFRTDAELRPWLFTIMHNLYVNRWRRKRLHAQVVADDAETDLAVAPAQSASMEIRDVLRGLDTLPDDQRQVLLLVAVEGFQYDEVARMLDVPTGTVMSRLSRARDRLRDFIEGRERPALRRVK
jgi:RNA polymerase sigma-70 factor, ECF subfamily